MQKIYETPKADVVVAMSNTLLAGMNANDMWKQEKLGIPIDQEIPGVSTPDVKGV